MSERSGNFLFVEDPGRIGAPGPAVIARIPRVGSKTELFHELEAS
jgi:hypothetical protein